MSELVGGARRESNANGRSASGPAVVGGRQTQLKRDVRATEGYAAQSAMMQPPVQMMMGGLAGLAWLGGGGGGKKLGAGAKPLADAAAKTDAAPPTNQAPATMTDEATNERSEATQVAPVTMPTDFSQEGVLRTWIGELNVALARRIAAKGNAGEKKLKALVDEGWADNNGMSYELLAAKAATLNVGAGQPEQGEANAPASVTTAQILALLAKKNTLLLGIIMPDYANKCMQFSEKLMGNMGAKRVDGTTSEKRSGAKGPLTATYRNRPLKDLPATLPAGYQICILSRPDWEFTEVGNHWFISAGNGYYLDNVMGITNAAGMIGSLIKATGDQWASRVFDTDTKGLRKEMATKFTDANPTFKRYLGQGRSAKEQKGKAETNPDFKAASPLEAEGRAAIKQFVKANADYHPKIWLVEPTTKADAPK